MRVAVLIDAENMEARYAERTLSSARALGDVIVVRMIGDFLGRNHSDWQDYAQSNGYELVVQPNGGAGKNSADIAMAINAMDILHGGCADAFCLVTSDRDLLPLAVRLLAAGKLVHVICLRARPQVKNLCSVLEFAPSPSTHHPLLEAYYAVAGGRPEMPLAEAGVLLRKHQPNPIQPSRKLSKQIEESGAFDIFSRGKTSWVRPRAA